MYLKKLSGRLLAGLLAALLLLAGPVGPLTSARADAHMVLTLGANLSREQKQYILDFFNVKESEVEVITVTNDDERKLLLGQYTSEQIGKRTYSCALVNPTESGGIQVKTANMNVVTSSRIASILSTSGVTNCEVLAAAPFMVSGTGALTGVMMAYETASDVALDPAQVEMAVEESRTVSEIGESIGQDEATLVVNDIKIRIVRDGASNTTEVRAAVDTTIDSLQGQLAALASSSAGGLTQDDRQTLYDYGDKLSKMNYNYDAMKVTLQRVTNNTAKALGISDPIQATFEDLSSEDVLPANSILRSTNDDSLGDTANITATNASAMEEQMESVPGIDAGNMPLAEALPLVKGVRLDYIGAIDDADRLLYGTSIVLREQRVNENGNFVFAMGSKDPNYRVALSDVYGNPLTGYELYSSGISMEDGLIIASQVRQNDPNTTGALSLRGKAVVPFSYADVDVISSHWAVGVKVKNATADQYDYSTYSDPKQYYLIDTLDVYYINGDTGSFLRTLTRADYDRAYGKGDYLNIQNRTNGAITTYDRSFNVAATNVSYTSDFEAVLPDQYESYYDRNAEHRYGIKDRDGNVVIPPFADTIYSIRGNYVVYAIEDASGDYKRGLVTLDGKLVLPAIFDRIEYSSYAPKDENGLDAYVYGGKGYFSVEQNDKQGYAITGGTMTFPAKYPTSVVNDRGVAADYTDLDGSMAIIAADGVETKLGSQYSSVYTLNYTDGMLWECRNDTTNRYDLLDWHGNVLMSECYDFAVSGDGSCLAVSRSYSDPMEFYKINYLTDADPDPAPAQPAATSEPAAQATEVPAAAQPTPVPAQATAEPAPAVDKAALIAVLQNTITTLQSVNVAEHQAEVLAILETEEALIAPVNASAGAMLTSAKSLVAAGAADAATVGMLLQSAVDILNVQ